MQRSGSLGGAAAALAVLRGAFVPVLEHAAEIFFDQPTEEGIKAERQFVLNLVAENATVAVGLENVAMAPVGERSRLLLVGEEAVVFVFGMDGDPGFIEGSKKDAELHTGTDFQAAGAGDDVDLPPWGEKEIENVTAFVEGEEGFRGNVKARLMDELGHGIDCGGVNYPFCDVA